MTPIILVAVYEALWAVLTALNVADVATTNQFLKEGKATEGDWISAMLQAWFGGYRGAWWIGKLLVVICLQVVGIQLYRLFDGSGLAAGGFGLMILILAGACIYYWGVVQDNRAVDRGSG